MAAEKEIEVFETTAGQITDVLKRLGVAKERMVTVMIEPDDWLTKARQESRMKNAFAPPGSGGVSPNFGNISIMPFWNTYPTDFEDENNLSLVVILKAYGLTICFPGDMEIAGWRNLLRDPAFVRAIGDVNIFVASHHGRANGCCEELFTYTALNPAIVVISDAGIEFATQETVAWYRRRAGGITLNGDNRHVLTTRHDGRIFDRSNATEYNGCRRHMKFNFV